MASQGSADPDEDSDLDSCAYCATELQMATGDWVFIDVSWGSAAANAQAAFTFCTQAHAAAYLAETTLPESSHSAFDPVPPAPSGGSRFRTVGLVILVLMNLAFYVLGLVTWLRWVWS